GVGWMRHAVPSHRSARVTASPEALTYVPTAVHEVAAVPDSPNSWPRGTGGVGVGAVGHPPPAAPPGGGRPPARSKAGNNKRDPSIAIPPHPFRRWTVVPESSHRDLTKKLTSLSGS